MKHTDRMNPIEQINEKVFPQGTPGVFRKVVWGTLILFTFLGFCFGCKVLDISVFSFFQTFFIFVLLGIFSAGVLVLFWRLMNNIASKKVYQKMDAHYKSTGITKEFAEYLKAGNIMNEPNGMVLHAYLTVQAECYREAVPVFATIDETALDGRQLAMYLTARIRQLIMTGSQDKAETILMERSDYLDDIYEEKPLLLPEYKPYADDALDYYLLSAAFAAIRSNPEKEAAYRKKAMFQISMRDEFDMKIYPQILELNSLYASAHLKEAHVMENDLRGEIDRAMISVGKRTEFSRLVGQARVFAAHTQLKAQKIYGERALPQ